MEVYNDDVSGIWNRVNNYIIECQESQSANVTAVNEFDFKRNTNYLIAMTSYLKWIEDQPLLDLPKTHPKLLTLEEPPVLQKIENLFLVDCIRLWERARDEVALSQSARNATGLLEFDLVRMRAVIEKHSKYMTDHIQKVNPIDFPESSPSTPET